jgi:hypothetical protein
MRRIGLERLPFGVPQPGKLVRDGHAEQRPQKTGYLTGENWMISKIVVRLTNSHKTWTERSLTTFGNDHAPNICEIGGDPAQDRKFEAARARARLRKPEDAR